METEQQYEDTQFKSKISDFLKSDFVKSTGDITLDSIKMALALVVALAWNTAIKYTINLLWKFDNNNLIMHIIYAIVVTVVFVCYIIFAQKKLGYTGNSKVQYAVVGM